MILIDMWKDFSVKERLELLGATVIIVGGLTSGFCKVAPVTSDAEGATDTLEKAGYKNITIEGGRWLGEGFYRTKFTADGPTGLETEGYVSEGLFATGSTIRFE